MDCSPPGSSIHGISQARILEWVAISFSRGFSWSRDRTHVPCMADRFFTSEPPGKPSIVFCASDLPSSLLMQVGMTGAGGLFLRTFLSQVWCVRMYSDHHVHRTVKVCVDFSPIVSSFPGWIIDHMFFCELFFLWLPVLTGGLPSDTVQFTLTYFSGPIHSFPFLC